MVRVLHSRERRGHFRLLASGVALLLTLAGASPAPADQAGRPLTIDDVLNQEALDHVATSPDGEWVAAVIRRGAGSGEAYGRTSYDVDSTRSDVWLLSTRTGERRRVTDGASQAAGYWCAAWSPDGRRLAMLSTAPEGTEPRGGDNVRLYLWERDTGALRRLSDWPVMTQTRLGSPLDQLDLRGGAGNAADAADAARACSTGFLAENAPFLWLDDQRLLVATLAAGEVSAALDGSTRPYRVAAADAIQLREGAVPTSSAVASGAARTPSTAADVRVALRVADAATGATYTVGMVPAYPFRGALTAAVSPDGRRLAVMATVGMLPPEEGRNFPNPIQQEWALERRLGFADLAPGGTAVRWATMPTAARLPLELYGWSPDGRMVALRARGDPYAVATPLFTAHAKTGAVTPRGEQSVGGDVAGVAGRSPAAVLWLDNRRLAARDSDGAWGVVEGRRRTPATLPAGVAMPDRLLRAVDGSLAALSGQTLLRLDPLRGFVKVADLAGEAFVPPSEQNAARGRPLVVLNRAGAPQSLATLDLTTGTLGTPFVVPVGKPLIANPANPSLLYTVDEGSGLHLRRRDATGTVTELLALNTYLEAVDWGERRTLTYQTAGGADLNAALILPPGYHPGRRVPLLVWVYGGYQVPADPVGDYMTWRGMPGLYNLYLYAARGYAVLVPSMPLGPRDGKRDVYTELPTGVLPAVDKVVELGIADPGRVGVFGQSYGGYSVMGLLGQTRRFGAGVAMAGISELVSNRGQFDPTARGYPGIEHEKSDNAGITDQFGLHAPSWSDPDGYRRNSPLSFVNKVETPLLLLHGEFDIRGAPTQAELFFQGLHARGRTAELVRYGGESHSLHQSPANVRDVFARTVAWFDRFLPLVGAEPSEGP